MRKRLCILSLSPIAGDSRVLRQIEHASANHDVTVVGWGEFEPPWPNVTMRTVQPVRLSAAQRLVQGGLLSLGRVANSAFERWYWRKPDHRAALARVEEARADLIHANEAIALPIAITAARRTGPRVLFDAHEYSPDQWGDRKALRYLAAPLYDHIIRQYAPRASVMATVSQGIAERYRDQYGLAPHVILNAPPYIESTFRPTSDDRIRLVHHGVAKRGRHLELLIDALALADDRFTLDLMLVDLEDGYLGELRERAHAQTPGRVRFHDPVEPSAIVPALGEFDIGVHLLPPVDFNHAMALPNKLFEFVMAGLAVAIGPSPEMARLCREHALGVVADDFTPGALAAALNGQTAESINGMKQSSLRAAKELNSDAELVKLEELYRKALA